MLMFVLAWQKCFLLEGEIHASSRMHTCRVSGHQNKILDNEGDNPAGPADCC
jgi:hypothetical protein